MNNLYTTPGSIRLFRRTGAWLLFVIVTAISSVAWSPAIAEEAFVVDVVREKPYNHVIVSAKIKGAFTPEIIETIQSGAPITFTYFLQLKRQRSLLWNETERRLSIKRMVKFDTLRKEYLTWEKRAEDESDIDFSAELAHISHKNGRDKENINAKNGEKNKEPAKEPKAIKDTERLKEWMAYLEGIDLGPTDGMQAFTPYYFQVKCEMKSIKLIPPFNYILFFVSLWDFDTDWSASSPFTIYNVSLPKTDENQMKARPVDTTAR
ncbi:hypothetical protein MNBD_NITROSPINAE01-971 [hydrothermal vent metagenome]|uniref:DUF4390 domain-containing protein n=1 Tax=hydrothermal vent metagenome TaxID=652676 RepID=A0A3B1CLG1_9ZZZZ